MKGTVNKYNPSDFENDITKGWVASHIYKTPKVDKSKDKFYSLYSYPYPSGAGLHVGHVEGMVANDISARYNRMLGKNVLMPMGWDSFGLPAENYAIKTGVHPKQTTNKAIKTFIDQINKIGISVDWDTEVAAHDPTYYKWTQWLFIKLYNKGLAYKKQAPANWCSSCQTVLANEQVIDSKCERCDSLVEQKQMDQWFFKITEYKDRLIDDLQKVDWPNSTKQQQINWIGRKTGINITYKVEGTKESVVCFTTRPDTNFGATFVVLAPEHDFVKKIVKKYLQIPKSKNTSYKDIASYVESSLSKTDLERQQEGKKKTGVFTGFYAVNNLNNKKLPIYISDFVLGGFGTGAVVGVPGHDKRDFDFAKTFDLPVIRVVVGSDGDKSEITNVLQVQEEYGTMINSEFLNGLDIHTATEKIMDYLEKKGWGKRVTTYRLRDWLLSRQRYWGCPIPIVYDPKGKPHCVKEEHLPWTLPEDVDFIPKGYSPLSRSEELKKRVKDLYGEGWTPEYDTMDTFVDSSWYFFRHVDASNPNVFADKEKLNYWLPTDLYMIGAEHIVLHLFYSRFFTKFLYDEGYIDFDEPFYKMRHMGLVLGPDGRKMSKRWGNVVNPNDVVKSYGGDTLRVYEMFMGPIAEEKPWNENSIAGVYRFLNKVWDLMHSQFSNKSDQKLLIKLNKAIKKVGEGINDLKFNTSIAFMMEFCNDWSLSNQGKLGNNKGLTKDDAFKFLQILAPFAPFITEEVNKKVFKNDISIHVSFWPKFDKNMLVDEVVTIPVQVNGKLRSQIQVESDNLQLKDDIITQAKEAIAGHLKNKSIKKEIYVPGKIVNFVI